MRGYFEIGVYQPKHWVNIGTLWRSAYQLGAAGIFTIGKRYTKQPSDTYHASKQIPYRDFLTWEQFIEARPYDCLLVGIEQGGIPLCVYEHPPRALYILGSEDNGLPESVLERCNARVSLDSIRENSYNVAVAGSIVGYHRQFLQ